MDDRPHGYGTYTTYGGAYPATYDPGCDGTGEWLVCLIPIPPDIMDDINEMEEEEGRLGLGLDPDLLEIPRSNIGSCIYPGTSSMDPIGGALLTWFLLGSCFFCTCKCRAAEFTHNETAGAEATSSRRAGYYIVLYSPYFPAIGAALHILCGELGWAGGVTGVVAMLLSAAAGRCVRLPQPHAHVYAPNGDVPSESLWTRTSDGDVVSVSASPTRLPAEDMIEQLQARRQAKEVSWESLGFSDAAEFCAAHEGNERGSTGSDAPRVETSNPLGGLRSSLLQDFDV